MNTYRVIRKDTEQIIQAICYLDACVKAREAWRPGSVSHLPGTPPLTFAQRSEILAGMPLKVDRIDGP